MANELERLNPRPPMAYSAEEIAVASSDKLTRGERKTIEEYKTQMAVVTGQALKTVHAEKMYGQMVREIHDTAVATLAYIEKTQEETKSATIRIFCEREKQIYMYQAVEMLTTGGQMLHNEVARSLYPPPKKNWWDW